MGRKNKAYSKDLHQQAYERLQGMLSFGESKKEAVANGTDREKIFSFNTYKSYWKHIKYFLKYVRENYPKCTTLKKAKKYVNEWLQQRADQGLSAWTVQLEAKALGKLYGISPDDENYFKPPKRNRAGESEREGSGVQGADRGGDRQDRGHPGGSADNSSHKAPGNAPGHEVVPGGVLRPRPQREGRPGAFKPHHRQKCGADHRADQGDPGRGKGLAVRSSVRRHSLLPGGLCHGHL